MVVRGPHVIDLEDFQEEMHLLLAGGPGNNGQRRKQLWLTFRKGKVGFRITAREGYPRYDQALRPQNCDDFEQAIAAYNEL